VRLHQRLLLVILRTGLLLTLLRRLHLGESGLKSGITI
jgi:hypothetical protein